MGVTSVSSISPADGSRTHPRYSIWEHVIPLPPDSLMWSIGAASVENFFVVADAWAQVITHYAPENSKLLDVGCGCGRTARLLVNNRWINTYIGFDVVRESVEWCNRYIVPEWHSKVEFHWFDLYSREYNPGGALKAEDLIFPCEDKACDVVFAASVFTHLLEPDAVHYLKEISRVLSRRGLAILSIHTAVPAGERFYGSEARIDMDPAYFLELAGGAGLRAYEEIPEVGGQQVFVFQNA